MGGESPEIQEGELNRYDAHSRGDVHLYTISNSVLRVYAPVLDDPTWFQLHTSVDGRIGGKRGVLLVLDADELRQGGHDAHELAEEDMFACIDVDGTLTVRAILVSGADCPS